MACSTLLKKGIPRDCANLPISGTRDQLILLNYDEVIELVRDATNNKEVTSILRKAASKGVLVSGYDNSSILRESLTSQSRLGALFTHEVEFLAMDVSSETYQEIENMANGRVLAVQGTNNNTFKILGATSGLTVSAVAADSSSEDTGGAYTVTLQSTKEKGIADLLYIRTTPGGLYSYADSKAAFEALLVAAA